jgi:hypothetical protein
LFRQGEAKISRKVATADERIGTDADTWQARMQKLYGGRLLGRFPDGIGTFRFAASPGAPGLKEVAERLELGRAVNLATCPVI